MPTKTQVRDKDSKQGRRPVKRVREPLSSRFDEKTLIKAMKIAGLVAGILAVFTFISVFSYLFTWKADQSLLSEPGMMSKDIPVENWGAKLGYRWGHFLVCRCFGLGSFFLVALFAYVSVKLFSKRSVSGILHFTLVTVTGAILSSAILSYAATLVGGSSAFGGGLGGDCGAALAESMINLTGSIVTAFLCILFAVLWLLYTSGRFSRWFETVGNIARQSGQDKNQSESVPADREDDVLPAEESGAEETVPAGSSDLRVDDDGSVLYDSEEVPADEYSDQPVHKSEEYPEDRPDDDGEDDARSDSVDTAEMEVLEGKDLSAEDVKDLPRIDVREELSKYQFPPLDLLDDYSESRHDVPMEELERNNNKIRTTLLNYKIQVEKVVACKGPTVTLYKVTPAPGVKISSIRNLEDDIAMALGAKGVRVVKLSDTVGIEVANERPSIVPLKSLMYDDAFKHSKYELPVAIGYTITQKVKVFDLTEAPHLLVAGATKQGKSVGLNVIITSLLYSKHPSELKLVFIDPKMVEFNAYSKLLKHYLAVLPTAANEQDEMSGAIVKTAKQAELILKSLVIEMNERYRLMSLTSANNVVLYNEKYKNRYLNPNDGHRYLPYIVVVIDEYADLIMSVSSGSESKNQSKSITTSIIRLAQKGRAAGIHVIIATQRPSVDVVTGIIKTNFPMRIAFRTSTRVDSNTILDTPGAEKLIGKGDMLYYAGVEIERVQCAMISMEEIYRVTDFIGAQTGYRQCYNTPYYLPEPEPADSSEGGGMIDMQNLDENFKDAAEYVVRRQKGSTSDLQRSLGMGYARAGRVMDQLEAAGIVGPQEGSKPRQVLVSDLDELQHILDAYMNQ